MLIAGVLARFGWLHLPDTLAVLMSPWVIGAAAVLAVTEFLADKIPAFDSLWDAVHTFIRIPAGAVLAAGALGHADPTVLAVAGRRRLARRCRARGEGRHARDDQPVARTDFELDRVVDRGRPRGRRAVLAFFVPLAFLVLLAAFIAASA